jgi:hypothetical protein
MLRVEKTVFISYRRANVPWALAVFQYLTHHGFDVFFDCMGIASGDFEKVILDNIRSRAHFHCSRPRHLSAAPSLATGFVVRLRMPWLAAVTSCR